MDSEGKCWGDCRICHPEEKVMDRDEFEYHVETIGVLASAADVSTRLTVLGICGWQLVHVQGDRYFFERPR